MITRGTILIAGVLSAFLSGPQNTADVQQTYLKLCGGCHGDDARGTQQGPGLSGNPSVRGRSAQSLRGFALSRSSFDVAAHDLTGGFHAVSLDDVSVIADKKRSHIDRVTASPDELRDVIAFLSRLTGVQRGAVASPRHSDTGIDF